MQACTCYYCTEKPQSSPWRQQSIKLLDNGDMLISGTYHDGQVITDFLMKAVPRRSGKDGFLFFDPAVSPHEKAINRLTELARSKSRKKLGLSWSNQAAEQEHAVFIKENT